MKMKLKETGVGFVKVQFRNLMKKVPDVARGQMHRSARNVVKRAQLFVPEDTQALRNSIRVIKTYGSRGRLQIDIVAGDDTITTDTGRQVDLNTYAALVHEAYETQVAPNGPGERTRAKMNANPSVKIGSRFLTRALDKEREKVEKNLTDVIERIIMLENRK